MGYTKVYMNTIKPPEIPEVFLLNEDRCNTGFDEKYFDCVQHDISNTNLIIKNNLKTWCLNVVMLSTDE